MQARPPPPTNISGLGAIGAAQELLACGLAAVEAPIRARRPRAAPMEPAAGGA
jgi:hypothetical protein